MDDIADLIFLLNLGAGVLRQTIQQQRNELTAQAEVIERLARTGHAPCDCEDKEDEPQPPQPPQQREEPHAQ